MRDSTVLVVLLLVTMGEATGEPNPPANVTITQTTCNSVTVNWTPPTDNGTAEITEYRVHVYNDSDRHVVHTNVTTMTTHRVTSLDPDTNYTVEITAENVRGFGNGSTNFTTKQKGTRPITVLAVQSRKVSITISGSSEVYICTLNNLTVDITSGQTVQQTGLTPNTNYTVNCHSVNDSCLEATPATFMTVPVPRVVHNITRGPVSVSEDGGSIQQKISWYPPASEAVMKYLITYSMGDSNPVNATKRNTTQNTSIVLTLSVPDGPLDMVVYNIWVVVVTKSEEQGNATALSIKYSTPGPPQDLQIEAVSCNSIGVSWLPPNSSLSGGLPLISYRVRYNGTDLHSMTTVEDKLEVDIPGLQPNTHYALSVSANNTFGWGEEAQRSNTTMPRQREQLFNVTVVKSKSLTMTVMMGGTFKDLQCEMSPFANGMGNFTLTQEKGLGGLTPNTQYTIHCVGKDEDGRDACIEQIMSVTTRKNLPALVNNVRRAGHSWVVGGRIYQPIAWDKPRATEDNEVPYTYVVRYKKIMPDAVTNTTETRNNKTTLVLSLPLPQQAVTYIVSVAGKADTERGNFSDKLTLHYSKPTIPEVGIPQILSCQSVNVNWTPPTNNGNLPPLTNSGDLPLTGYTVRYGDGNEQLAAEANATSAMLEGLTPNTTYNITVAARNAIGEGKESTPVSVMTEPRHRGSFVTAQALTSDTVIVNTTQKEGFSNCSLSASLYGQQMFVPPDEVQRLRPDTNYTLTCDVYDSSTSFNSCIYINTHVLTKPAKVLSVRAVQVQPNDIQGGYIHQTISWRRPDNHVHITHYLIRYGSGITRRDTEGGGLTTVNSTESSTVLVLPIPANQTTYSVWVAAVSEAGQGEVSDRVDFNYSTPDPPTGLNSVNSTCNSIRLTWSAPHYTGGVPLEGYTVRWRGRGSPLVTDGPDVTAVTITRLSPNTSYSVRVTAVNAIGNGQMSQSATVSTTPRDKPLEVSVSTISSTSLHITTQPPPGLEMVEVNCTLTAKETSSYIRTVSLNNTRDGGAQGLTDNLVPYSNYTATCLVFKDGVDQCYIGNDTTQTYTDIPSAPPQEVSIVSTSSHSFTMTWAPPPKGQQNGEIMSYEVEYREEGSNSTVVSTTRGMRYTAEDLTTDRVYQFRVAANTVKVTGPFSEWIEVGTIPTVTNLRVLHTTTNSAIITWDQPPRTYRVFLHGEATDYIPQSRVIQLVDVTGQTTHIVEGLDSFRNYSIGVYLKSNLGQGSSATVNFQIQGRVTGGNTTFVQLEPTHEQSATAATIGGFVGGTVFGVLATLLVGGIVMGAIKISRKDRARTKHSAAVDASTCLAPDAIPMDTNPSYEEVHVYEHIDKKDSKQ